MVLLSICTLNFNKVNMFKLEPLPYNFDALEPHIDARTMEIHHDKHHQAYTDKLNAALEGTEFADKDVNEILSNIETIPEDKRQAVINNGGGYSNHNFFWEIMSPDGGGEPTGELNDAINSAFGSFEEFKKQFSEAAASRFGSGWAWLVKNDAGDLEVISTPNQDSPIMGGDTPIIGIDVWEHAYYLNYQNKRPDYVSAWWNVVNWERANENYTA